MGLIIKDKLQALIAGYPTVSDKYNVAGGILAGTDPVLFGELVKVTGTPGYFEKAENLTAVTEIGGFALGTNVKLAQDWPGNGVRYNPGEAFNLMINGFIAAELDANASVENKDAIPCVAAASTDTTVQTGKTYYTRTSSSAGAGYLNDGTYAYTKVASPTGNPSTSSYYEVSVEGANAIVDNVTPNAKCYVILATGKITTADHAASTTVVELPNCVFTGYKEMQGTKKLAEIYIK